MDFIQTTTLIIFGSLISVALYALSKSINDILIEIREIRQDEENKEDKFKKFRDPETGLLRRKID